MTESPIAPDPSSRKSNPLSPLALRVRQRLDVVGEAVDRRANATRPQSRRRKDLALVQQSAVSSDPAAAREHASLRIVFRELGDAHRRYRRRTGNGVTPALRAATTAFKQEPSLLSLVPVVGFLDELGILAW